MRWNANSAVRQWIVDVVGVGADSAPWAYTVLRTALDSRGVTNVSSCMYGLGQLLSTPLPVTSQRSTSFCSAANTMFFRIRAFLSQCLSEKRTTTNEGGEGSLTDGEVEELNSFDVLTSNVTDILDEVSEKTRICCTDRTAVTTPTSLSACFLTEVIDKDLSALHELILTLNSTTEKGVDFYSKLTTSDCRAMLTGLDKTFRQLPAVPEPTVLRNYSDSRLQIVLQSVKRLEILLGVLSTGQSSAKISLKASPDVFLLLCSSLFPVCDNNQRVPPCPSTCWKTVMLIRSLRAFLNTESVPILNILVEAVQGCTPPIRTMHCLVSDASNDEGFVVLNITSSRSSSSGKERVTAGFCLNTDCKSPLRSTSNERHFDKNVQKSLVSIHIAIRSIFPNNTLPLNRSILPCGRDCVTVGFTENEHRASQIILTLFSSISVASIIFSFVVFFFNRKTTGRHFIRRVTMKFLAVSGIAQFPYMFSAKGASSESILCYSDGTLITHPSRSNDWCWWTAVQTYLFATVAVGYTTVLTFSWQQLAHDLSRPGASDRKSMSLTSSMDTWWSKYKKDVVSFVLVVIAPFCMAIAVGAQQGYEALPICGACSLRRERNFLGYYTWYNIACFLPNMIFLVRGVQILVKKYGVFGFLQWMRYDKHRVRSIRRSHHGTLERHSNSSEGLKRFSKQLLVYLLLAIISFFFNILYGIYVHINVDHWKKETKLHIECAIASCSPDTCPSLPKLSLAIFISPFLFSILSVFVLTTWAYSPIFLTNVPGIGHRLKRCTSSQIDNGGSSLMLSPSKIVTLFSRPATPCSPSNDPQAGNK